MTLQAESLTPDAFAPFGAMLSADPTGEPFQVLFTEPSAKGWRVAQLRVQPGPLGQIHRHPDSDECFAPMTGEALIAVAAPDFPDSLRLFRLTAPVCVRRNTWHQMVADSPATLFVAENASLTGEVRPLPKPVSWT